ncbi:hypothetical protein A4X03_0g9092 [Tilletia caries]|uniref:Uncharacterized protein n=1 Tax=Tilletia caries TaxID=13290 RepID=A0A8T8SD56_9BASI|nr:hypothetical protein A4X03_0g9092 [Tilletia caries]
MRTLLTCLGVTSPPPPPRSPASPCLEATSTRRNSSLYGLQFRTFAPHPQQGQQHCRSDRLSTVAWHAHQQDFPSLPQPPVITSTICIKILTSASLPLDTVSVGALGEALTAAFVTLVGLGGRIGEMGDGAWEARQCMISVATCGSASTQRLALSACQKSDDDGTSSSRYPHGTTDARARPQASICASSQQVDCVLALLLYLPEQWEHDNQHTRPQDRMCGTGHRAAIGIANVSRKTDTRLRSCLPLNHHTTIGQFSKSRRVNTTEQRFSWSRLDEDAHSSLLHTIYGQWCIAQDSENQYPLAGFKSQKGAVQRQRAAPATRTSGSSSLGSRSATRRWEHVLFPLAQPRQQVGPARHRQRTRTRRLDQRNGGSIALCAAACTVEMIRTWSASGAIMFGLDSWLSRGYTSVHSVVGHPSLGGAHQTLDRELFIHQQSHHHRHQQSSTIDTGVNTGISFITTDININSPS